MDEPMELISQYISYCLYQKNLDDKTVRAYKTDLTQCFSAAAGVTSLTKQGISRYIESLHNQYKPKTVKRKIASLKAFASYLLDEEFIVDNPFHNMRIKYKDAAFLPKTIPTHILRKILNHLYDRNRKSRTPFSQAESTRDIAVVELMFATGLRISELCGLNTIDYSDKTRYIRIMGKGSKERIIHIQNRDVIVALKNYLSVRSMFSPLREEQALFINRQRTRLSDQSVRTLIRRCTEHMGAHMHITPHMFRHTFATMLLDEGVDIRYIQQILGHSSILTTQIYTQVSSKKQKSILLHKHPRRHLKITTTP